MSDKKRERGSDGTAEEQNIVYERSDRTFISHGWASPKSEPASKRARRGLK